MALSCFTLAAPALAWFYDGNRLLDLCEREGRGEATWSGGVCYGFIMGAYDAQARSSCIPSGVKTAQIFDIAKMFLRDHPEKRQMPAAGLVSAAIKEKFPCN